VRAVLAPAAGRPVADSFGATELRVALEANGLGLLVVIAKVRLSPPRRSQICCREHRLAIHVV
jgi:hypothetical protein